MSIVLPDRLSEEGAEARILLAECATPEAPNYSLEKAQTAMRYMDAVLWNRQRDPVPFGAKKSATLIDIIRAPGQFAGFEAYPSYSSEIIHRIQNCLDIANNLKDRRNDAYAAFVNAALDRAAASNTEDPSPGRLVAWRTARRGSPGSNFKTYATVLGNTFFWIP